jgi:hypothetical protein
MADLPPPLPPVSDEPRGTPWERRESLGFVPALVETTKQVLTGPTAFFRAMPVSGGIGAPLFYAVILGYLGLVVQAVYQAVLRVGMGSAFEQFGERGPLGHLGPFLQGGLGLVFQLVFGPVFLVVGIFIGAGIYHLVLMLLGQARQGFEATLRVVCYGQATSVLMVLPFCGGILTAVAWIVVGIIGLAEAHRIGRGSAAVAILAPLVLICCCCVVGLTLLFGGIAGLASQAR